MELEVVLWGNADQAMSDDLRALYEALKRADVPASLSVLSFPETKQEAAFGLATGRASASALNMAFSAIADLHSRRPGYSVHLGDSEWEIDLSQLGIDLAREFFNRLVTDGRDRRFTVRIERARTRSPTRRS